MKLIAITGSIGTGKTTLAGLARDLGYNVLDVDGWVRALYYQKDFIEIIGENFSNVVVQGKVDKRKLRNIVFDNNEELKKLEALIHPFLKRKLKKFIGRNGDKPYINFIDVALLFEMGWDKYVDLVIVTTVHYDVQKQRVINRDKVTAEHFDKINNVQMSGDKKIEMADIVIDTDKSMNLMRLDLINIVNGMEHD